ncbi:hypothetical protein GGS24DRAFT_514275 [Hypoxylon argillaceum]|nr:hypothetical protein GGS24DRAFT_514275 [Hypoxylon argillaceum]
MATNLGPLSTDFTIASNCAVSLNDIYQEITIISGHTFDYLVQGPLEQTSCYPSSYTGVTEQFYSPARCPSGFTAPCQSINSAGTVRETVLTCCPTQQNYICQTKPAHPWESTLGCTSRVNVTSTAFGVSKVSSGTTVRATSTFGDGDGLNAFSIQVRYQSTDFVPSTASTASPAAPSTTHSTLPMQTHQSMPSSTTAAANVTSIGGGAIAGIAVGVIVALFVSTITGIFLIRRRRRREQTIPIQRYELFSNNESSQKTQYQQSIKPQSFQLNHPLVYQELQGSQPGTELSSREVPRTNRISELQIE